MASHGANVDAFDGLFEQAAKSPDNRYALLNFFLRFYFSRSYNDKAYYTKVKEKLTKEQQKYEELIGKVEYSLVVRYADSKFDEKLQVPSAEAFS